MAAIPITINGVICDLYGRTITGPVKIVGEAMYSDRGVGGGPIIPPPDGGGQPPDPNAPRPSHPIAKPGDPWWGQDLHPSHPIALPGDPWWPKPPDAPEIPPPGSPPVMIPGTQPVQPITPPPAIIVDYPGIGKVLVPQPKPPA